MATSSTGVVRLDWTLLLRDGDHGLSWRAVSVGLVLASYMKSDGSDCYPGVPTIARGLRVDARTVRKGLAELENEGFLQTRERPGRTSLRIPLLRPLTRGARGTPDTTGQYTPDTRRQTNRKENRSSQPDTGAMALFDDDEDDAEIVF